MRGAHGDRFSVRGEPGGVYNLLSLPNVSFNTEFVSSVFKSPFSRLRVNGSFARHAYWKLRTPQTGKMLRAKPVSIGNASATRLATVPPVSLSRDTKDSAPPPLPFFSREARMHPPRPGVEGLKIRTEGDAGLVTQVPQVPRGRLHPP